MDALAFVMKSTTFLGVLLASAGMNLPRAGEVSRFALLALAIGGVALMVANTWLAGRAALALVVDVAYAAACGLVAWRALREASVPRRTTFTLVVPRPPGA